MLIPEECEVMEISIACEGGRGSVILFETAGDVGFMRTLAKNKYTQSLCPFTESSSLSLLLHQSCRQ